MFLLSSKEFQERLVHGLRRMGYSVETAAKLRGGYVPDVVAKKGEETLLIEAKVAMSDAVSVLANVARLSTLPQVSALFLALPPEHIDDEVIEISKRLGIGLFRVSGSGVEVVTKPKHLPPAALSVGLSFPNIVAPSGVFDLRFSLAAQNKIVTNATVRYLAGKPWCVPNEQRNTLKIDEIRPEKQADIFLRVGVSADAEPGRYFLILESKADDIKPNIQICQIQIARESKETIVAEVHNSIEFLDKAITTNVRGVLARIEETMLDGTIEIRENVKDTSIWAELGNFCLQNGLFRQAQQVFENMLETIQKWEQKHNETLHKGMALYNIGLALYSQGKINESRKYFERAYEEDKRTYGEAPADKLLAKQAIDGLFAKT